MNFQLIFFLFFSICQKISDPYLDPHQIAQVDVVRLMLRWELNGYSDLSKRGNLEFNP